MRIRFPRGLPQIVLVVVGLLVAVWAAGAIVGTARASDTDSRLRSGLDAARQVVSRRAASADARASRLASSESVQSALAREDTQALAAIAAHAEGVAFFVHGRLVAGRLPVAYLERAIDVFGGGRVLGRVVVAVPLDDAFLGAVRAASSLKASDSLAVVTAGRVTVGPSVGARLDVGDRHPATVTVADKRRRARADTLVGGKRPIQVVALGPASGNPVGRVPLGLALLAAALLGATALLDRGRRPRFGRERRRRPMPVEVATARDAIALVGETLAATHNPDALLPVILEAAIEATGAAGGALSQEGRIRTYRGTTGPREKALSRELSDSDGTPMTLMLWPPRQGFSAQAPETADWFAGQASIALENARLHSIVQQQAVTDELTELANRRHLLSALKTELSRSERFGSPLAFVLADIDDFKRVNDRFGHQTGDVVLRRFAEIVRECVREVDVPARLGGEEFAVVLPETDLAGGVHLAERLRERVEGMTVAAPGGEEVRVTASFGVASYPDTASDEALLVEADSCLYRAKAAGKNLVVASGARRQAANG